MIVRIKNSQFIDTWLEEEEKIKKAKKKKRLHLQKQKALHHMLNVLKSFSVKQYKNTSSGNGIVKRCNFTSAP